MAKTKKNDEKEGFSEDVALQIAGYDEAESLWLEGKSATEISNKIAHKGIDKAKASAIVDNARAAVLAKERRQAIDNMSIGVFWVFAGFLITLVVFDGPQTDYRFLVVAAVFGIYKAVKGFTEFNALKTRF